jgi:putative DNA methylase
MPLTSKWWLSKKKGKEVWIEPKVNEDKNITYSIHYNLPDHDQKKAVEIGTSFSNEHGKKTKATFKCIVCNAGIVKGDYIDFEANSGRMSSIPIALVAEGKQGRIYLPADNEQMKKVMEQSIQYLSNPIVQEQIPLEPARGTFASNAQGRVYGFRAFSHYFTPRQLITLITFISLLQDVREKVMSHASFSNLASGQAYADAIATYLALAMDKCIDYWSSVCSWNVGRDTIRNTFARQAIAMAWDFAEANPFSESTGNFLGAIDWIAEVVQEAPGDIQGKAVQRDATAIINGITPPLISTDPPYYDNVSYADLSDFFYVWLRRSLRSIYSELFSTMQTPKAQELVATPYRFNGSKNEAQKFFETGLRKAFEHMRAVQHSDYPLTIYYAFKQSETEEDNDEEKENKPKSNSNNARVTASTGWDTMLEGLIHAGFTVTGTWPIRTEREARSTAIGTNALASSIVLVCRPRPVDAPICMHRPFLKELKIELSQALKKMQHEGIAPVDLAQASIGPGMKVFSQYRQVVESDGTPLRVRTALQLINQVLDEVLAEQEGAFDMQTRWVVSWFEQYAMEEGPYGIAETLSKARNISLHSLEEAGILVVRGGKVQLLKREEYGKTWGGRAGSHLTTWEVTQRIIQALINGRGEQEAGALLRRAGNLGEAARDLAYRLYTICERKGWSAEALPYNILVMSWSEVSQNAHKEIFASPTLWTTVD